MIFWLHGRERGDGGKLWTLNGADVFYVLIKIYLKIFLCGVVLLR